MWRSAKYLALVRLQPCCAPVCRDKAEHAHHFGKRFGGGGIGCKPHDSFTVPLCATCHHEIHQRGTLGSWSTEETETFFAREALRLLTLYLDTNGQK
jgi:hypothetical protein